MIFTCQLVFSGVIHFVHGAHSSTMQYKHMMYAVLNCFSKITVKCAIVFGLAIWHSGSVVVVRVSTPSDDIIRVNY